MQPAATDLLREAYLATVLHLQLPDGRRVKLAPRERGACHGEFPAGIDRVYVITAANPRSQPLLGPENASRNDLLRRELLTLVGDPAQILPARGCSPDGRWCEESFAVVDPEREALLDLATRHGQLAVYEWTATHRAVVWTAPERADDLQGWVVDTER